MSKRLVDTYVIGAIVEIQFANTQDWWLGQVVQHDAPGLWVRTAHDGRSWFVTNTRRIRHQGNLTQ